MASLIVSTAGLIANLAALWFVLFVEKKRPDGVID